MKFKPITKLQTRPLLPVLESAKKKKKQFKPKTHRRETGRTTLLVISVRSTVRCVDSITNTDVCSEFGLVVGKNVRTDQQ